MQKSLYVLNSTKNVPDYKEDYINECSTSRVHLFYKCLNWKEQF